MTIKLKVLAGILSLVPAFAFSGGVVINGQQIPASNVDIEIVIYGWTIVEDDQTTPTPAPTPAPTPTPAPAPPPTATCSTTLANTATPKSWRSFWGVEFPLPVASTAVRLDVGKYGYNYIKFNTGNANGIGSFQLIATTTSPGLRRASLSKCPGDFNVAAECKQAWGVSQFLDYSTSGYWGSCQLEKGTDYYFNVTFTDEQNPDVSWCQTPVGICLVKIRTGFSEQ